MLKFKKISSHKMAETFACPPPPRVSVFPCLTPTNQFFQQTLILDGVSDPNKVVDTVYTEFYNLVPFGNGRREQKSEFPFIAMCAGIFTNFRNCPIAKSFIS